MMIVAYEVEYTPGQPVEVEPGNYREITRTHSAQEAVEEALVALGDGQPLPPEVVRYARFSSGTRLDVALAGGDLDRNLREGGYFNLVAGDRLVVVELLDGSSIVL